MSETYEPGSLFDPETLTSSAPDSPAATSASSGSGAGLKRRKPKTAPACSSNSSESPTSFFDLEGGSSLRTSPACSLPPVDAITQSSYGRWATSGFTTSPGECWTAVCTECLSPVVASSSLRDVLQETPPDEFFLRADQAQTMLRRAEKRGRALPAALAELVPKIANSGS